MGLMVKLGMDGKQWEEGLQKASKDAENFGKNLGGKISKNVIGDMTSIIPALSGAIAGAFSASAIYDAVKNFGEHVKEVAEGALRLNVDTTTFQKLNNVMEFAGMKGEDLAQMFDKIAVAKTKMEQGGTEGAQIERELAALGITLQSIEGMNAEKIFFKITDALHGIKPTDEQIAALKSLTGRGGPEVLKVAQIGFTGDMANKNIIAESDIQNLEEMREKAASMESAGSRFWRAMGVGASESLLRMKMAIQGTYGVFHYNETASEEVKRQKELTAEKQKEVSLAIQKLAIAKAQKDADDSIARKAAVSDEKKAAEIDKETEAIKKRNREDSMSPAEKELEIKKEIARLQGDLHSDWSATDLATDKKKIEELKGELARLQKADNKPEAHHAMRSLHTLGNQAIGGIMLSHDRASDEMKRDARKSAKHLESIDKKTTTKHAGAHNEFP
jgi:hypothetical protein